MWSDTSCGNVIFGGELVMIVASMIGRNELSKDSWYRECHGDVCGVG